MAVVLAFAGIATLLYWVTFFTSGSVQATAERCYLVFERAFPAADAWAAGTALVAAEALWRRRPRAVLFAIAAGSAYVFLGLMDVLFNLEHGIYARPSGAMAVEAVINVFCLTVGPFLLAYFWRQRDRLPASA